MKNHKVKEQFYGSTTVGERGQVVVPRDARKVMKLKAGEKLLAFGAGNDILILTKLSHVEKIASHLSSRLTTMRQALSHARGK